MIIGARAYLLPFAALAFAVPAFAVRAAPPTPHAMPATDAYVRGDRSEREASCVRCHASVAQEHETSLHARSFRDASFQRGYAIEPHAFCRSCHAPESSPAGAPDAFASARGVGCITCHSPGGSQEIFSAVRRSDRAALSDASAPHAVVRTPDFGTRTCVGCHDFSFPHAEGLGDKGRMQKTGLEHAASPGSGTSCASCHMRGHGVTVSRDTARLKASLDVKPSREGAHIRFELRARGVGHAYPTGDMFRRLVLRVKSAGFVEERSFGRTFRSMRSESGEVVRFEVSDTRLAPAARVELSVMPGAREILWEVVYQRVTGVAQSKPFTVAVEDEIVLAEGTL